MINYYIIGPKGNDDSPHTYWNSLIGWTTDFNKAHAFPIHIVDYPYPNGATGLMRVDNDEDSNIFFPLTNN
jgi:hypothetical protein